MNIRGYTPAIAAIVLTLGCSKPAEISSTPAKATTGDGTEVVIAKDAQFPVREHHHTAPHGGTLLMIGEHAGHIELVLDTTTGTLDMYALDGEAENPVRLNSIGIPLQVSLPGKATVTLQLKPVENVLTGETVVSTSQYRAQSDELKGATLFSGVFPELAFRGLELENVAFSFPGGNE